MERSWTTGETWLDGETPSAWGDGASAVFTAAASVSVSGTVSVSNLTPTAALVITGDSKLRMRSLRFGLSENGLTFAQLHQITYNGEMVIGCA